jgi:hypothetical protein
MMEKLIGRRRVGKPFLIRQYPEKQPVTINYIKPRITGPTHLPN